MQLMVDNSYCRFVLPPFNLINVCFFFCSSVLLLDYDQAIQRMCVNRGPDDNQDRCAITAYNYKKVYMCLCQGDLCNSAPSTRTGALWWWWWWWCSSSLLHHYSPLLSIIFSYTTLLVIPSSNIFFRIHFS